MLPFTSVIFCLAFILGFLLTGTPWGWLGLILAGTIASILRWSAPRTARLPFAWRMGPPPWVWWVATGIGLFAMVYLQLRVPYPSSLDVSRVVDRAPSQSVSVMGIVKTMPRLTRSQKSQFQLQAKEVMINAEPTRVKGQLYVTVSQKQSQEVHPGQRVQVSGILYRPQRASIPSGFDFADYLTRQGIFAGMAGKKLEILDSGSNWGWWALRQRIVRSQSTQLKDPEGSLVSALVLGARAVDLPAETRDSFVQAGLAHALAASGFHVSIILAVVLAITQPLPDSQRAAIGCGVLIAFGFVTGFAPSVFRAILMGIAGLFALVTSRKTQPVGLLLVVAVTLLIINPLWIWDLGFQLSFLATLGLVVSVPTFMKALDWLPPRLATLIAIPIAATLWTLPLQLYAFGVVPLYGLLANVLATPFLTLLTVGSFVSGVVGALIPPLGGLLAGLLYYPAHVLILIVKTVIQLPGSTLSLGTISVIQLIILYGLLLSVWLGLQHYWQGVMVVALVVIILPVWQIQSSRFEVTIFDSVSPPIMVIQQPGGTLLLNTGDQRVASQGVLPFLQRQGINRVELAVATATWPRLQDGWQTLLEKMPVATAGASVGRDANAMTQMLAKANPRERVELRSLQPQQALSLGQVEITFLRTQPAVLQMQIQQQNWLIVTDGDQPTQQAWLQTAQLPNIDVLWWVGQPGVLPATLEPEVIVFSTKDLPTATALSASLASSPRTSASQTYWTARDGAIQWTPQQGFQTTLSPSDQATEIF
ncbi:MAG: ComEC/Rec2 family competence protein [Thermosynechococcaceae cyanobacterium]